MKLNNPDNYKKYFEKFKQRLSKKAEVYANDPNKLDKLLDKANKKAKNNSRSLSDILEKFQLLFSIVRDYAQGRYKDIPYKSIVLVIVGIIYFITPLDAVPDFIPFLGFVDDATILGLIISQLNEDLESYKTWKNDF